MNRNSLEQTLRMYENIMVNRSESVKAYECPANRTSYEAAIRQYRRFANLHGFVPCYVYIVKAQ